jgi:hypothetical protein
VMPESVAAAAMMQVEGKSENLPAPQTWPRTERAHHIRPFQSNNFLATPIQLL